MQCCRLCRSPNLRFIVDFGKLAVTNQFFLAGEPVPFRQPMSWHECASCGVVQLTEAPPLEQIRPRFPWQTYQEPDGHLGQSAQDLKRVCHLQPHHRAFGLSHEERPLLDRLGICEAKVLDPVNDLGITLDQFGRETIQSKWTVECARRAAERHGRVDLFVALYSLEHAHDAAEFLAACREFLKPGGCLLVEVPDCSQAFRDVDLTVIWEEHVLYFTEQTLHRGLTSAGFQPLHFRRVPGMIEDQLVWIGTNGQTDGDRNLSMDTSADLSDLKIDVDHFAQEWPLEREAYQKWARAIHVSGQRLAVFGAGHRAATLVDIMGIAEYVDCVIDDSLEKQNFCFPAGGLPIYGSSALINRGIHCCLLVVNPEVEERIVNRNPEFLERGGTFVSCYPRSSRALRLR